MTDCTPSTPWRQTADTTPGAFRVELAGSPVAAEADALCDAASPYGRLYLAHSYAENKHDRVGILITPEMHNNLALRPRGYPEETGQENGFATFDSYVGCLAAWRRRLTDPALPYVDAVTMIEYATVYNPPNDTHPITGVPNKPEVYCQRLLATINRLPLAGGPMPDLDMTKGLIPLPPFADRLITNKPQGSGWGNYGKRTVKGFVLHRMQGSLWGTDAYFRDPAVRSLTDYGCDHRTGEVIRWCDPTGDKISPWASGPVSAPYGDGAAFVNKYAAANLNVVNRDQVSWEVSGFFAQPGEVSREDPWEEASIQRTAQALAHYAHDYGIPWDRFPIAPQDGFSFLRWHQEFTIGTGKVCPGKTLMEATDDLIARAKEIMRRYQTGEVTVPPPAYVPLDPPPAVAEWDGTDKMIGQALAWAIKRTFTARKPTPVHQYADRGSGHVRAPLSIGEKFDSLYWLEAGGEPWVVTASGARIPVNDSTPDVTFSTG